MSRISTHVLDIALGKPAAGVPVRLDRLEQPGEWRTLGSAQTDEDGRCRQLLPAPHVLSEGIYRIVFETRPYFAAGHAAALYPVVEITIEVRPGETHFHIPLLLSPNGYTTYRGT